MNWKNLIKDLIEAGYSQNQIAKECGITQPAICHLLHGNAKTCTYETGAIILNLHKKVKKQTKAVE